MSVTHETRIQGSSNHTANSLNPKAQMHVTKYTVSYNYNILKPIKLFSQKPGKFWWAHWIIEKQPCLWIRTTTNVAKSSCQGNCLTIFFKEDRQATRCLDNLWLCCLALMKGSISVQLRLDVSRGFRYGLSFWIKIKVNWSIDFRTLAVKSITEAIYVCSIMLLDIVLGSKKGENCLNVRLTR